MSDSLANQLPSNRKSEAIRTMAPTDTKEAKANFSPAAVRCICITASLVVLSCALSAFGVACEVIPLTSQHAGPCPDNLALIAFASAGGLLALSAIMFLHLCRIRNRLTREDEEKILRNTVPKHCDSLPELPHEHDVMDNYTDQERSASKTQEGDDFALTQKSVDVSYWIEHQDSTAEECLPLECIGGATANDSDDESSEAEFTSL